MLIWPLYLQSKISDDNDDDDDFITKYSDIFCLKNERSFCNAKTSHIFSTKREAFMQKLLTFFQQKKILAYFRY